MRHSPRWRLAPDLVLCAGLIITTAPMASPQQAQQPISAKLLVEEATKQEVVDGDLKGAVETYQKIVALEGVPRATAARALLHLGQCYEKLGNAEARKAYERLVREFGDQPEEARLARGRLAALGGGDTAMRVRRVWAGPAGDLPVAVTRDGRSLTLQDWPSENLAVRDLATGQLRKLTNKDPKTYEFAALSVPSPDGRHVAYAWYNKDSFTDLRLVGMDGSNPRVLAADAAFKEAEPFDWSPDGRHVLAVFYKQRGGCQIALVSVVDGSVRVLKSLDGGGPKRVRFSPDGRFVAYDIQSQPGSAKYDVFVLAVDGGRETGVVQHPANDVLFDWTPDGKKLLFGSDRSGTMGVWWVTMAGGQVEGVPEVIKPDVGQDARPIGFTRDGSYFYRGRTNLSDVFIAEVDFASGRLLAPPVLATQRFAGSNSWPAWSPDGRQLAYLSRRGPGAGWGSMAVWLKDMASGEVREIPSGLETVIRAGWFPDGRSLLAIAQLGGGTPGQFRINVQTGESEPVDLFKVAGPGAAAWSRDGRTMFFQRWRGQKTSAIVARDVSTGQEREIHSLADPSVYVSSPLVSPDGQHLAMVVNDAESRSKVVVVVPLAGGEARDVLRSGQMAWPPSIAWAPDSRGVLFVKQPNPGDPKTDLWLVPVQGGEPRKLDLGAPGMRELCVHPDARRIAFTSGGDRSEVWVMENFLPVTK
ncbi:MAG: tetratricopeptide repeat protein [Vicinamibacterales bacterium]